MFYVEMLPFLKNLLKKRNILLNNEEEKLKKLLWDNHVDVESACNISFEENWHENDFDIIENKINFLKEKFQNKFNINLKSINDLIPELNKKKYSFERELNSINKLIEKENIEKEHIANEKQYQKQVEQILINLSQHKQFFNINIFSKEYKMYKYEKYSLRLTKSISEKLIRKNKAIAERFRYIERLSSSYYNSNEYKKDQLIREYKSIKINYIEALVNDFEKNNISLNEDMKSRNIEIKNIRKNIDKIEQWFCFNKSNCFMPTYVFEKFFNKTFLFLLNIEAVENEYRNLDKINLLHSSLHFISKKDEEFDFFSPENLSLMANDLYKNYKEDYATESDFFIINHLINSFSALKEITFNENALNDKDFLKRFKFSSNINNF